MGLRLLDRLNSKLVYRFVFILSILGLLAFVGDFGFDQSPSVQRILNALYLVVLLSGISTTVIRYLANQKTLSTRVIVFDALSIVVIAYIIAIHFFSNRAELSYLYDDTWLKLVILLTFIREFAEQRVNYKRSYLNPAQLFILSFLGIILMGALLLMLPKATYDGLGFLNALFTSTSAVCVTGLIVVDTGTYFTPFGQNIILVLIQLGGLGILTFASSFSYFFKGMSSYENQLVLGDMTNAQKMGEVFSNLKRILIITFSIEFLGAVFIFFSTTKDIFSNFSERCFFALFHSISAFCNAGFSTMSNSLYEQGFRFNYIMQLVVILLIVLGGLGFPIVINLLKYLKYKFKYYFFRSTTARQARPWVLNLNSRITLITTFSLIVGGTIIFYFNEYSNTLAEHHGFGKVVGALFEAVTPRTAGFNNVDMGALHFSTLMVTILLMWIGASPASTGGGIKTSTFAIATLNFLSLAKGKSRIEVYRREIAELSVRRAFAIISLSLLVIGLAILAISKSDSEKTLLSIAFECFSAYSTVGLSVGITAGLSSAGKWIIILVMFIGRVNALTILIALFNKTKYTEYRYPTEEILIN